MNTKCVVTLLFTSLSFVQSAIPGTFFWKPRLGLDLYFPTTEKPQNLTDEFVVAIDGYLIGLTVMALANSISSSEAHPHLNPMSAYFYTNAYRWGWRHLSLLPEWFSGYGGNYCDTQKVWRRRFNYNNLFIPRWLQHFFPYVDDTEWKKERAEYKRFLKYSERAFRKAYRYPSKVFNNFKSEEDEPTSEESSFSTEENN